MWAQAYSASNNIHHNFPPIMSDGRIYSSYQPQAQVNDNLRERENIQSNWEYRRYLTDNADSVAKFNSLEAANSLGLPTTPLNSSGGTNNTPFLFQSTNDLNRPVFGYNNSNLKSPYLSREQLQSKLISPVVKINNNNSNNNSNNA